MKRVLLIAYGFPPAGGAGVQRTAKFVRYLPQFGWLPTVLTAPASCHGVRDDSHIDEVPEGVAVIRAAHFDPVARFTRMPVAAANGAGGVMENDAVGRATAGKALKRRLRAIAREGWLAVDKSLLIPDQAVLWCPRALVAGLAAHFDKPFDLLYATGEPYSAYFTAAALSRLTRLPFVLDMRDPWTLSPYRQTTGSRLRQAIEQGQERRLLSGCRACVFANPAVDMYKEQFPQWADKFHYLPNGYDAADFAGVEAKRFDKVTLVHSGTFLQGYRTADVLLTALKELLGAQPQLAERLQVIFVGKIGEERQLIDRLQLGAVVKQVGYLPHKESLSYLLGADALLLVGGAHAWEETGKVYEYMAARKPVLALVNLQGSAARLLREYGAARLVERTDVAATRTALEDVLDGRGITGAASATTEAYERRRLTQRLARVFDNCAPRAVTATKARDEML